MNEKIISVFGTSRAKPGDGLFDLAYRAGKAMAQAGYVIANGGYNGTMLAGAKGAMEAGGKTIGVTCKTFKRSRPNEYIEREISTACLEERLNRLIELGQGYVVLPGGTGTLVELALVWELKNKSFFLVEKPVILLGTFWKPLVELIAIDDPDSKQHVIFVDEPEELSRSLSRYENQ